MRLVHVVFHMSICDFFEAISVHSAVASWELFNRGGGPKSKFSQTNILHLPVHDNGGGGIRVFLPHKMACS